MDRYLKCSFSPGHSSPSGLDSPVFPRGCSSSLLRSLLPSFLNLSSTTTSILVLFIPQFVSPLPSLRTFSLFFPQFFTSPGIRTFDGGFLCSCLIPGGSIIVWCLMFGILASVEARPVKVLFSGESGGVAGLQASGSDEAWQVRESAEPT
ncbi:hypothetical protein E2C01_031061 [Portunus trituberculatus]|uniref:Transmembrane protein n=1 Tax=Portunus trituberculatus TaxID=210409 RepID=A0A5B7EVV9_PORTR|nr:hypothetical protein [Portunus trituberculatus]